MVGGVSFIFNMIYAFGNGSFSSGGPCENVAVVEFYEGTVPPILYTGIAPLLLTAPPLSTSNRRLSGSLHHRHLFEQIYASISFIFLAAAFFPSQHVRVWDASSFRLGLLPRSPLLDA